MKKYLTLFIICNLLFTQNLFSQNYHEDYAYTVFYEDFNGRFDTNAWDVRYGLIGGEDFYMWVNSTKTVNQNNGNLQLRAVYSPGYSQPHQWIRRTLTRDYISGEVKSKKEFTYGIFECSVTFEYKKGAFPAFWLYNDDACDKTRDRPEIDIVEMKYEEASPTLDYNIFRWDGCPIPDTENIDPKPSKKQYFNWSNEVPHAFKCVWMPSKVEFSVDNGNKMHTYTNKGQPGYPDKPMHILLSQQLVRYYGQLSKIQLPSKSTFHWVRAKEFFEVPTISCPDLVCTKGTSVLRVNSKASGFSWRLSPSNLFSGPTSGSGKTATINAAAGARGEGKITYTFRMPSVVSGESFTVERTFWIGKPDYTLLDITTTNSGSDHEILACSTTSADAEFDGGSGLGIDIDKYQWDIPNAGDWDITEEYGGAGIDMRFVEIEYWEDPAPETEVIKIRAHNTCGWSSWKSIRVAVAECGGFKMTMSPNPTIGETTFSLEPTSPAVTFKTNEEWELEIYSQTQGLVEKKTITGNTINIQTSGWIEGIYFVKAKYKDTVIQGKLIVKK